MTEPTNQTASGASEVGAKLEQIIREHQGLAKRHSAQRETLKDALHFLDMLLRHSELNHNREEQAVRLCVQIREELSK